MQEQITDLKSKSIETIPFPRLSTIEEENDETFTEPESFLRQMSENGLQENEIHSGLTGEDYTSEIHTLEESDAASSVYSDAEEMGFVAARDAILEYTAAENQLSASQLTDLQQEMELLRSNFLNQQAKSSTNLLRNFSSSDERSPHHYPTPDTDDSDNERLSPVSSSFFTAPSSTSIIDQTKEEGSSSSQVSTLSTNDIDKSSSKTRSTVSEYYTARTSASENIETEEVHLPSTRTSTSSSDLDTSASSEALLSPSAYPTGQTTPMMDPELGRRQFTLDEIIDIDQQLGEA